MQPTDILELLPSIQYAMLCYSYDKLDKYIHYGNTSPHDNWTESYFDSIGAAADFFAIYRSEYYEELVLYVSFERMMEYYRLCRVYSRLHGLRLKDNRFFKDAADFVNYAMDFGGDGGYYVRLQTKVNHKWASGLVIRTDENYFNSEFELAEAVFEIGAWYERSIYRLRNTLLKEFALWLPALPEHREEDGVETQERAGAAA